MHFRYCKIQGFGFELKSVLFGKLSFLCLNWSRILKCVFENSKMWFLNVMCWSELIFLSNFQSITGGLSLTGRWQCNLRKCRLTCISHSLWVTQKLYNLVLENNSGQRIISCFGAKITNSKTFVKFKTIYYIMFFSYDNLYMLYCVI